MSDTPPIITKNELRLLVAIALGVSIWSYFVAMVFMKQSWFYNAIPPVQFILFNVGLMILVIVAIGFPISFAVYRNRKRRYWEAVKCGLSIFSIFGIAFELLWGPYFVNLAGQNTLYGSSPKSMTQTAIDCTIIWCLRGVHCPAGWIWYITYVGVPILVFLVIALVYTWKQIVQHFDKW